MGRKTAIAWTDHTFNMAWGCHKISPGCKFCYADRQSTEYGYPNIWGEHAERRTFSAGHWIKPLSWNADAEKAHELRRVFSSSMCDNFEGHLDTDTQLPNLWDTIRRTPNLHWQLLTKRPENILERLPEDWGDGYPNVWLGVSIENNDYCWRAKELLKVPARVRFISYEPALGPLDGLAHYLLDLDWVIYGGESGPERREHDLAWPREMRDMCEIAEVPFFYKQESARYTETGTTLDGKTVRQFPINRRNVLWQPPVSQES